MNAIIMVGLSNQNSFFIHFLTHSFSYLVLIFLVIFPNASNAKDDSYLRKSNSQVWQLIQNKTRLPVSSYRPSEIRKSSQQLRFLKKSPIDYKERDLGIQEAKGSFQGNVRSRSEDLTRIPRSHESTKPFYGNTEGRNMIDSERSIPQPRIKKKKRTQIRQTDTRIKELISQWKYE